MCTVPPRQVRLNDGRVATIRCASPEHARGLYDLARHIAAEHAYTVSEPDEVPGPEEMEDRIRDRRSHTARLLLVATDEMGHVIGELDCGAGCRRRLAHRARFGILCARGQLRLGIGSARIHHASR